jgi:hypothetical protein
MSRADEIAQGLRDESGSLTFPLNCEEYSQGFADFRTGAEPPRMSSASYDLGRNLARRKAEEDAEFKAQLAAESERRINAVREVLKDHPEVLAEYDERMAALKTTSPAPP